MIPNLGGQTTQDALKVIFVMSSEVSLILERALKAHKESGKLPETVEVPTKQLLRAIANMMAVTVVAEIEGRKLEEGELSQENAKQLIATTITALHLATFAGPVMDDSEETNKLKAQLAEATLYAHAPNNKNNGQN